MEVDRENVQLRLRFLGRSDSSLDGMPQEALVTLTNLSESRGAFETAPTEVAGGLSPEVHYFRILYLKFGTVFSSVFTLRRGNWDGMTSWHLQCVREFSASGG